MTEKRFSYMEQFNGFCDVYDTGKILSCMRLEYVDKTVNLLNEQHETIQVLKASNGEMEDYLARLEEENEQLKEGMIGVVDRYIKNVDCNPPSSTRTYMKIKGALVNIREDLRDLIGDLDG